MELSVVIIDTPCCNETAKTIAITASNPKRAILLQSDDFGTEISNWKYVQTQTANLLQIQLRNKLFLDWSMHCVWTRYFAAVGFLAKP